MYQRSLCISTNVILMLTKGASFCLGIKLNTSIVFDCLLEIRKTNHGKKMKGPSEASISQVINNVEAFPSSVISQLSRNLWVFTQHTENHGKVVKYHIKILGTNINIKVQLLHSHLRRVPDNLSDSGEGQGERLHQNIKVMEKMYPNRWDRRNTADNCWSFSVISLLI